MIYEKYESNCSLINSLETEKQKMKDDLTKLKDAKVTNR